MPNIVTGTDSGETLGGTPGDDDISALGGDDFVDLSQGHDTIDGGPGADLLRGAANLIGIGPGARSYTITASRIFDGSGALDTGFANFERISFRDTQGENVTLDATGFAGIALSLTIGTGSHSLTGSAAADTFSVLGGSGSVDGGAGVDLLSVRFDTQFWLPPVRVTRSGEQVLLTQAGVQSIAARNFEAFTLFSSGLGGFWVDASEADAAITFFATEFADVIVGSTWANLFSSGFGGQGDIFAGFGGADRFLFDLSALGGATILDLDGDDEIDLSMATGGASFIGTGPFTGVAGQYRYYFWYGETFLVADTDGDRQGDQVLTIANDAFILAETAPGSNIIHVVGAAPDPDPGPNVLIGTEGDDVLESGAGDDRIEGRGGNDMIGGGADNDRLDGGDGNDTLYGDEGDDAIDGGSGQDIIYGGYGDDLLDGGSGPDSVNGDDGNDTLTATGGGDWLSGGLGDDILTASSGSFNMFGDEGGSTSDDGNDRITLTQGGTGSWLDGGGGDDFIHASGSGMVIVGGGTGDDDITIQGYANGNVNLGPGNDTLRLPAGFFTMTTGDGRDTIIISAIAAGFMTIIGISAGEEGDRLDLSIYGADPFGAGTLVIFRNGPSVVIDHPATGMRYVLQSVLGADLSAYNLGVPNPIYAPQGMILDDAFASKPAVEWPGELVGADGPDLIRGHGGNDYLLGAGGNDRLEGGTGADRLEGGSGDDSLDGGAGNDSLAGGIGDDLLEGGGGDDTIDGGAGNDTLTYAAAASAVEVDLSNFEDQVTRGAGTDVLIAIENVIGSPFDDSISGDSGANLLIGADGADTEAGGEGHDSVWGGAGDDLLDGGPGDDTIDGGAGNDTVTYAAAEARVEIDLSWLEDQNTRGAGVDTLVSIENAIGSAFDDKLTGNGLANRLTGGGGGDLLAGGEGGDRFVYLALSDSTAAAADLITDFTAGDRIDLSALDADGGMEGDQAFHLGITAGHAGDIALVYDASGDRTAMYLYVDGDAVADATIWLAGNQLSLTGADIVF